MKKNQNTSRKIFEKKSLRIEDLESKQLLSAVGFETVDNAPAEFASANLAVNDTVMMEESPAALAGESEINDEIDYDPAMNIEVKGNIVTFDFSNLADKELHTIVFTNTKTEKPTFRSFWTDGKGAKTYKTSLTAGDYNVAVYEGSIKDAKDAMAAEASEEEESIEPVVTADINVVNAKAPKLSFDKAAQTEESVTFKVTYDDVDALDANNLVLSGKLNGVKADYVSDGSQLVATVGKEEYAYDFSFDDTDDDNVKEITISGLNANTMQIFSISFVAEEEGDYGTVTNATKNSNTIIISTTRVKPDAPTLDSVDLVEGAESSAIQVNFTGEEGLTYTIQYSYMLGKKEIVRTANARVKVSGSEEEGFTGSYTIKNLKAETEYSVWVFSNKDKNHEASDKTDSESVTTLATMTAPILRQVGKDGHSVSIQIINWNKFKDNDNVDSISFVCGEEEPVDLDMEELKESNGVFVIGDLDLNTTYPVTVTVKGVDEVAASASNKIALIARTDYRETYGAVEDLAEVKVVPVSAKSDKCNITLSWTAPMVTFEPTQTDYAATVFTVKYWEYDDDAEDGGESTAKTTTAVLNKDGEWTIRNLKQDTTYYFDVAAKTNVYGLQGDFTDNPLEVSTAIDKE